MGRDRRRRRLARGLDQGNKECHPKFVQARAENRKLVDKAGQPGHEEFQKFINLRPLDQEELDFLECRFRYAVDERRAISFHLFKDGVLCGLGKRTFQAQDETILCVDHLDDPLSLEEWFHRYKDTDIFGTLSGCLITDDQKKIGTVIE